MNLQRFIKAETQQFDHIRESLRKANECLPTHWNGCKIDMRRILSDQHLELLRLESKTYDTAREKCYTFVQSMLEHDPEYQVTKSNRTQKKQNEGKLFDIMLLQIFSCFLFSNTA